MPEYIDRKPLIDKLKEKIINPTTAFINNVLIEMLEKAPVVDITEGVRCKDCEYWNAEYKYCKFHGLNSFGENGFCSFGQKKEGTDDGTVL